MRSNFNEIKKEIQYKTSIAVFNKIVIILLCFLFLTLCAKIRLLTM